MTDILARQRQLIGSDAEWLSHGALILGDGEIGIERTGVDANATFRFKVGDGVTPFSGLPWIATDLSAYALTATIAATYATKAEAALLATKAELAGYAQSGALAGYVQTANLRQASAGAADAGKVPQLDNAGKLSPTFLSLPGVMVYKGQFTPTAGAEYPTGSVQIGDTYILGAQYAFTTGTLAGRTGRLSDLIVHNSAGGWDLIDESLKPGESPTFGGLTVTNDATIGGLSVAGIWNTASAANTAAGTAQNAATAAQGTANQGVADAAAAKGVADAANALASTANSNAGAAQNAINAHAAAVGPAVHGLGTMSQQNSDNVTIVGGLVSGVNMANIGIFRISAGGQFAGPTTWDWQATTVHTFALPGAAITIVNPTVGQVCRLWVRGPGPITVGGGPGVSVAWAHGHPQWGTGTLVQFVCVETNYVFASTVWSV
jgi:hypothetical protein